MKPCVCLQALTQEGTLRYMSPEVLEGSVNLQSGWCLQGDVYALGLLLWEIWMRCSDLREGHNSLTPVAGDIIDIKKFINSLLTTDIATVKFSPVDKGLTGHRLDFHIFIVLSF